MFCCVLRLSGLLLGNRRMDTWRSSVTQPFLCLSISLSAVEALRSVETVDLLRSVEAVGLLRCVERVAPVEGLTR